MGARCVPRPSNRLGNCVMHCFMDCRPFGLYVRTWLCALDKIGTPDDYGTSKNKSHAVPLLSWSWNETRRSSNRATRTVVKRVVLAHNGALILRDQFEHPSLADHALGCHQPDWTKAERAIGSFTYRIADQNVRPVLLVKTFEPRR